MKILLGFVIGAVGAVATAAAPYDDSKEISYRGLHEVSGIASTAGGYLLVSDATNKHLLLTDGKKNEVVRVTAKYDQTFDPPQMMDGFESIDSIVIDGEEVTLILSEDNASLFELGGSGTHSFGQALWGENCGRGLEGLAVRHHDQSDNLQIAVLWEGGYTQTKDRGTVVVKTKDITIETCGLGAEAGNFQYPRIATFVWKPGEGMVGEMAVYDVVVPFPGDLGNSTNHQRFRGTDLVWHGDALLVLLGSSSIGGNGPYEHTWLQAFCPDGRVANPIEKPKNLRLDGEWKAYFGRNNWEAMDWHQDDKYLVLGYDDDDDEGKLAVFEYSETNNRTCENSKKEKKRWNKESEVRLSSCPHPADSITGAFNSKFEVIGNPPTVAVPYWIDAEIEQWNRSNDPVDSGGHLTCKYSSKESGGIEFELLIRGPVDESSLASDVWESSSQGKTRIYTCKKDEPEDCTFDDFT